MANEYLQRTPTSTGNTRVWTWSGWLKLNDTAAASTNIFMARTIAGGSDFTYIDSNAGEIRFADDATYTNNTTRKIRDSSGWFHLVCNLNTTSSSGDDRMNIYINGVLESNLSSSSNPVINYQATVNTIILHTIGNNANSQYGEYNIADVFFIDGQALTPDVFGFYKQGKGYISVGSTQATDFRPGQWVPKTPRVIKTEINRRGGFGVNGFYLPMNDSRNFGADFHGEPNSIITLNERLPQPRVGVATTASVGLGYTDALRADPFAANLVLALPFVSGGLSSGFGDYAPSIKGSGSAKVATLNGGVSIANTSGYYGSSVQFVKSSSQNVTYPSSTDFTFGTGDFTLEYWINYTSTTDGSTYETAVTTATPTDTNGFWIGRTNTGTFYAIFGNGSSWTNILDSAIVPSPNQWHHIALCKKGSVGTIFLNGVAVGINTNITQSLGNVNNLIAIGGRSAQYSNAYLQDLRVYKGVAKYTGGFDVPRPYTPVGIATWRSVPDTTANNFCTWNPIFPTVNGSQASFINGNLTVSDATSNGSQGSATIGVSTGKWYYEAIPTITNATSNLIGIRPAEWFTFNAQNRTAYRNNGDVYNDNGTVAQTGTTYTSNDIIGVAFDMNNKRLWFSKNGSWVYSGDPNSNLNPVVSFASTYTHYTPSFSFDNAAGTESWTANFGQNPTFSGNTTAGTFTDSNGKGLFKYQPPSGFLALCEDNLPTPAISDPGKHFKTVLWTGDGNSGRSIVGVGFTPDLVWVKERNVAQDHVLHDSVRGAGYYILSNSTQQEVFNSAQITSFNSDGFTVGTSLATNENSKTFVAWCWRAGAGTTSTNTNGSITSVVGVNQDAGFSIVRWTGNGSSTATVGHGLGRTPAFLISKARGGTNDWWVVHKSGNGNLQLNTTSALITSGGTNGSMGFPSTLTSSTFTFTNGSSSVNNVNQNGIAYVTYCWAEIEGYSKFGSYVGNGSADGPFVFCNFSPAFVLIKRSDGGSENWFLFDNARKSVNDGDQRGLFPNLSDIEGTLWPIDFLSNGFKNRYVGFTNINGATYVFAAFAQSPFSTANSK